MVELFLLAGLVGAASIPDLMAGLKATGADDDDDAPDDTDGASGPKGLPGDALFPDDESGGAAERAPEPDSDLFLCPSGGCTVIPGFRPGSDTLTLRLPAAADDFTLHDAEPGQDSARLGYVLPDGDTVELRFDGLTQVPADDILLSLDDADQLGLPDTVSLGHLLSQSGDVTGADADGAALSPVDPETIGDPGAGAAAADGPALTAIAPEADEPPAEGMPQGDAAGPVLVPVTDPEPSGPETAELGDLLRRDAGSATGLAAAGRSVVDVIATGPQDDHVTFGQGGADADLVISDSVAIPDSAQGSTAFDLGDGDDTLVATDGAVWGFGGPESDVPSVGAGASALHGGAGDDLLSGHGDASADDPGGRHLLDGGAGADTIHGGPAGEWLDGGEHGPAATGPSDDTITGGGGDDTIRGGWGADFLSGGAGDDLIDHRGTHADRVDDVRRIFDWQIDNQADTLDGGDGNDTLRFDTADQVTGGAGTDVFWLSVETGAEGAVADVADFVPGEDMLRISLDPEGALSAPDPEVLVTDNGADAEVRVDGRLMAVLRGGAGAGVHDVHVERIANIFV